LNCLQYFFKEIAMPRRARDFDAEAVYKKKYGAAILKYRKVQPDEADRAEPFPVWNAGIKTFAQFGIGIGIYFMQLLTLSVTCFFGGLILAAAMYQYNKSGYGLSESSNPFVPISAACALPVNVTATSGCDYGETECIVQLRASCELPYMAGAADLAMSVFVLAAIVLSKFFENMIVEELDEAVQTAQDYSIVVNDPNKDADNPDEWYEFFSRFGKVRYVTITRKNSALTALVAQKHSTMKKLKACLEHGMDPKFAGKKEKYEKRLTKLDAHMEEAYAVTYPACRVYVTFEQEEHQRLCLQELEVPDIAAIMDIQSVQPRKMFRGTNVLDVCEPPEPDSVLWENVETGRRKKMTCEFVANFMSIGLLVTCYFVVQQAGRVSSLFLAVVIALADLSLPVVFEALTDLSAPHSEGKRQSNLQVRLFLARLLLSTIFPYLQTSWNHVLDADFISQIVSVQISACFVTPIIAFFDIGGIIERHVTSMFSDTQGEMNSHWMGSTWSLAERYTGISKILFVSLYYTLLNPIALVIAMLAFALVFLVDRFLLLRRWKASCMLDSMIARRLRQQAILAVALHMAVTTRFIYSWPMDSASPQSDGSYAKVDKHPDMRIWLLTSKDWMTEGQASILRPYRITALLVCLVAVYIWIIDPVMRSLFKLFCYEDKSIGDVQDVPFTAISKTACYVPTTLFRGEQYLCSYIKDMLPRNKPSLLRATPGETDDLSGYVPPQFQAHVLSVVKYYGDPADGDKAELGLGLGIDLDRPAASRDEPTTANLPRYVTSADNVLAPVAIEMPNDLMEKIRPKTVEASAGSSRGGGPLSPEERKQRRVKRNYSSSTSGSSRGGVFTQSGSRKVEPLPPILFADSRFSDSESDDHRPSVQMSGRSNRVSLRPIPNSLE
jgi:hypothetical protein